MSDLEREARTPGVQTPVEHQGAADAPVSGRHAQQVAGAPAGAVPVLGEGGEVDVVARERGSGETGRAHALGEDPPHGRARGPGQVEGVQCQPVGFGDGGRYGESGAHAAAAGLAQQIGPGLDYRAEHLRRVGVHGLAAGCGRDDLAAEPYQRGAEAVGVHLCGEHDGAVLRQGEPVRGAALRTGRGAGPGVDPDQAQRLQFGGDRACRRPGHAEFGGEDGTGGGAAGVHELQRGAEGSAAPVQSRS